MKRDMELIRNILLEVEKNPDPMGGGRADSGPNGGRDFLSHQAAL
jgi:hypothetical protein